jgi:hypothetical protein
MAETMSKSELVNELVKATLNGVAKAYAAESTRPDFHSTEPVIYPMASSVLDSLARAEAKLLDIEQTDAELSSRRNELEERMHEMRAEWLARWGDKY